MALLRCKNCSQFYSDRLRACPECGSEFIEVNSDSKSAAIDALKRRRDEATRGASPTSDTSSVEYKTLLAVRSIAIFLIFSFNAGLIFAYAVYSDLNWNYEYSDNPVAWIPWTLGWIILLLGGFLSAINLAASSPKK